ncbi:peroxiredoxin [Agrobacterium sp. rho-13.3]|uniref:peroxiredoxin n=1 Tax=Agrobacterium sp. rho-13.3 TaxID=3072980 RepID=UPI002A125DE6|nr:peroxiredoxin [Agrobacterium sp. rho-13.3]MDX8311191.1 peroxiredoxin [Agrobacterium sp. rho-13.3]
MTDLTIGEKAPDFTLPRNGGGDVSLSGLKGKAVALYFYPKDDTSGCTAEAIDFSALGAEFEAANAVVIGISPDSVKSHDKFAAKHALTVMLAADEERQVLEAYAVWKEKSMYGKKYMGVERTTVLIAPDGTIAKIWNKVKVPGHAADVLEAAKAL